MLHFSLQLSIISNNKYNNSFYVYTLYFIINLFLVRNLYFKYLFTLSIKNKIQILKLLYVKFDYF